MEKKKIYRYITCLKEKKQKLKEYQKKVIEKVKKN